jgi:hypothetical protein
VKVFPRWNAINWRTATRDLEFPEVAFATKIGLLALILPNHFARILVFPDSEKNRLTETIIPGPLTKFHLADHFRFDPMATFHFGGGQSLVPTAMTSCREVEKGTRFNLDFVQL